MWFLIATIGYLLLAIVFILDKLIVSKSAIKPVVYTFYSTIFMFGTLLVFPFVGFGWLYGIDWLWAVVSGLSYGIGLWTFYKAVNNGEMSHLGPFSGAMVTIFLYLLGFFFLAEKFTPIQIAGIVVLVFASLLLSFEKSKKHNGVHLGFFWAAASGLLFAISHASAKYLYEIYPFWTGFVWTRTTTGLVGLLLLLYPAVRRSFRKKKKQKTYARKHAGMIIVANKVLAVVAVVLVQYAMALGSVTIVGALAGMQYALLFLFIYLLTKLTPKIFKEYFTKKELVVEAIAIVLVVLGSVFFVF